jgi:hypothetical protein
MKKLLLAGMLLMGITATNAQGIFSNNFTAHAGTTIVGKTSTTATTIATMTVLSNYLNYDYTWINGKIIMGNDSSYNAKFKIGTDSVTITGLKSSMDYNLIRTTDSALVVYMPAIQKSAIMNIGVPVANGFICTVGIYNGSGGTNAVKASFWGHVATYTPYK